ncbi:MAG TPA: hypothetical protein VJ455_05595 [Ignavibacteria bacterium]|nr:hypothetical protein [Ignavibacteria bacterium]
MARVSFEELKRKYNMNNNSNIEEEINLELERELEGRRLDTILGFIFLAVWILSILILINQN